LDPRAQVLDVLADHDKVDVTAWRGDPGVGLRRPQVRVQVELLTQRHIDRAKAGAELGRERSLEGDAVAPHRLESLFWKRRAALGHRGHADIVNVPLDLHAGRLDRAARCLDDLRARAVTRDQRDGVRQDALPFAVATVASYFARLWPARFGRGFSSECRLRIRSQLLMPDVANGDLK